MAFLFASNNSADFINAIESTVAGTYDSARVPYSLAIPDNTTYKMRAIHPASTGTTTWYHWLWYAAATGGPNEDGYLWTIYDQNDKFLHRINITNFGLQTGISGNGTSFSYTGGGAIFGYTSNKIFEVDVMIDVTPTDVTVEWYVDQVLVNSQMTVTNTGSLEVGGRLELGAVDSTNAGPIPYYGSEIIISETDTRGLRLSMLRPDSAGFHTDWSGAYTGLNDDDYISGMGSSVANDIATFGLDSYGGGEAIAAVMNVSMATKVATGPQNLQPLLRKGGTDYLGTSQPLTDLPGFIVDSWLTDPSDSNPWTTADLSSLESGFKSLT